MKKQGTRWNIEPPGLLIDVQRPEGDWRSIGGRVNRISAVTRPERASIKEANGKNFPTIWVFFYKNSPLEENNVPISFFRNEVTALCAYYQIKRIEQAHTNIKLNYEDYFKPMRVVRNPTELRNFKLEKLRNAFEQIATNSQLFSKFNSLSNITLDEDDLMLLSEGRVVGSSFYHNRNDIYELGAALTQLLAQYQLVENVPNDIAILHALFKAKGVSME